MACQKMNEDVAYTRNTRNTESGCNKLQRVQNAAARLIFQESKYCHVRPLLFNLHWLPVKFRIDFKILLLTYKRVPYTFFVTREWAFLLCVKREWGFNFSVIRESIFYRPWENGFRFFVIREISISLRVICEPTTFAGILFSFLKILASLKLVNYTILDVHSAT